MNRILKAGSILIVTVICIGLLTGCGERSAARKIGKEARYYIANKYKFRPDTSSVELRKTGQLEGVWHKTDGGTATMEYKGDTFHVYVSLTDPDIRYDDYLGPDIETYLSDYFDTALICDEFHVWATYGVPANMVPGDVKTVEDVFAKLDNIQIYVSTFGLDRESAKSLDVSGLGERTQISVIDWSSKECVEDEELMREAVVGLESDSYTDGFDKVTSYYQYSEGNVKALEK
ncbi:MAG: hypothetical protein II782_11415 [Oscillospiraceae bacterium]|nr:hypothetical protein [Oscillospiraceae bacterium]